jgi:hypothetical protein
MISVAICGDSWFTADLDQPGKSFGEIMCARNNWTLHSLARGGCSNFTIALQVDKAIELDSSFVILGTTTPDRAEFPIINDKNISVWESLKKTFDWHNWFNAQPEVYVKSRGISNVLHTHSLSSTHPWISDPTIVSESLNNLMFRNHCKLTKDQVDALQSYMLNLYDSGMKRQDDSWIISDACRRLEKSGIPYLIFVESLYQWDFSNDIEWIPEKNVVRPKDFSVWNDLPRGHAGFHYDSNQGSKLFADYVEPRIKEYLNDTRTT